MLDVSLWFPKSDTPDIDLEFGLGTAPLTNSWIINILGSYIALNMTPYIDCYWEGAVPKV